MEKAADETLRSEERFGGAAWAEEQLEQLGVARVAALCAIAGSAAQYLGMALWVERSAAAKELLDANNEVDLRLQRCSDLLDVAVQREVRRAHLLLLLRQRCRLG